jgi:hypothetical protein
MNNDEEHLKLLSIFHYVVAGIGALCACFPVFHLAFGIVMIVAPQTFASKGDAPPAFIGWLITTFAAAFIIVGWIVAVCIFLAGRFLAQRRHYQYCLVMAGIECIFMPFGTVLGVFTIMVLMRPPVKELFKTRT